MTINSMDELDALAVGQEITLSTNGGNVIYTRVEGGFQDPTQVTVPSRYFIGSVGAGKVSVGAVRDIAPGMWAINRTSGRYCIILGPGEDAGTWRTAIFNPDGTFHQRSDSRSSGWLRDRLTDAPPDGCTWLAKYVLSLHTVVDERRETVDRVNEERDNLRRQVRTLEARPAVDQVMLDRIAGLEQFMREQQRARDTFRQFLGLGQ